MEQENKRRTKGVEGVFIKGWWDSYVPVICPRPWS